MRYHVHGVDRETGTDESLDVMADSEAQAIQYANESGIAVSAVRLIEDAPASKPLSARLAQATKAAARVATIEIIAPNPWSKEASEETNALSGLESGIVACGYMAAFICWSIGLLSMMSAGAVESLGSGLLVLNGTLVYIAAQTVRSRGTRRRQTHRIIAAIREHDKGGGP